MISICFDYSFDKDRKAWTGFCENKMFNFRSFWVEVQQRPTYNDDIQKMFVMFDKSLFF